MNSNNNTSQRKSSTTRNDEKPLVNQIDQTNSYTYETFNKDASVKIAENTLDILNTNMKNEVKQCSTVNDTKTYYKQDGSNQFLELKEEYQDPELSTICRINDRYRLNFKNYIKELHKALLKECNYNLLDHISLNASLDIESMMSVTNQTLNAIKVPTLEYNI